MNASNLIYLWLHPFPLPSLQLQHNYQSSLVLSPSPIDPVHASSFPLSIHPSLRPSIHLSIQPFISIGMWEVKWTHLMGLCVSRKWTARVSHWLYRWATHCCPRLPWCQRKCHISWEELEKKKVKKYRHKISISNLQPLVHPPISSICNMTLWSKGRYGTVRTGLCSKEIQHMLFLHDPSL